MELNMDPIMLAITTALGNLGATAINDAYQALKAALQKKYGVDSDLVDAVNQLEKKPKSESRQGVLQEEIEATGISKDEKFLKLAQALLKEVKSQPGGEEKVQQIINQSVKGDRNIFSGSGDVTIKR
jgi:hypothetical protein